MMSTQKPVFRSQANFLNVEGPNPAAWHTGGAGLSSGNLQPRNLTDLEQEVLLLMVLKGK